ncbi:MAG: hypothetical protein BWY74_04178 [Firmicutes bacterium ADurb.Bin419]|nr:MAG: hypothetical protein BWY74_04178 [Firmicutes bacterium ADurb.Bin419]
MVMYYIAANVERQTKMVICFAANAEQNFPDGLYIKIRYDHV